MDGKLSRRKFVKCLSTGLAGGYLGLRVGTPLAMMGGGMMGGGGSSVIDPPVGALLKDPATMVNISTTPGIVEVNLESKISKIAINGTSANLMTYNGLYPGATIRVKKGDVLKVNFKNSLPSATGASPLGFTENITNLHTHGWHVSPLPPSDYVMNDINSGETYNHVYDTSLQEAGTLNFYHPHKHGLTAEQVWSGLAGALVVEDENTDMEQFETHILVLKDITISNGAPASFSSMDYTQGKEGSTILVNGQVNPRLTIKAGQVQRWRIVNASNARFYKLNLENHTINLIGTDGGLLDKPHPVPYLLLAPGERVDVLIRGTQATGSYRLRSLAYSRGMMSSSQTITLMTATYNGTLVPAQSIPASINPDAKWFDPNNLPNGAKIVAQRTLILSLMMGRGYINGRDFDVNPFTMTSRVGTYEIWNIINNCNMDHPFHQHVNSAQVLSISGGDANYAKLHAGIPALKDTVIVPKFGSVKMLVPVMDYTGMTMFHCHILEHEDIGMAALWNIM